jgi:anti-sigma factor RsiW
MTDHLSQAILNALADGELSAEQLAGANRHLAVCPLCTSNALYQSLLKSATAKAGQRYAPPPGLQERLALAAAQEDRGLSGPGLDTQGLRTATVSASRSAWGFRSLGWATAAVLVVACLSWMGFERAMHRAELGAELASAEHAALITEVFDQHVATLAANAPPQVVSTDRHTVKPWFQGKIPFSFNLPQSLPNDTTLDGANLTYLDNQPVAQLLFSMGKHRVSVFFRQQSGPAKADELPAERSGFHVTGFTTNDLEVVAVSDVDPSRLTELVNAIRNAQTGDQQQAP